MKHVHSVEEIFRRIVIIIYIQRRYIIYFGHDWDNMYCVFIMFLYNIVCCASTVVTFSQVTQPNRTISCISWYLQSVWRWPRACTRHIMTDVHRWYYNIVTKRVYYNSQYRYIIIIIYFIVYKDDDSLVPFLSEMESPARAMPLWQRRYMV